MTIHHLQAAPPATTATAQPRLHLLGSFRLKLGDDDCGLAQGPQRVLAALTLRGRMSRTRLAGLLWPETPQTQAQTNVRQALWRLVQATPGANLVSAVGCDLELNAQVASDVGVLLTEAHGLRNARMLPPESWLDDLLRAEAVELLPDWDDDWLDVDRERLRQLRLHVLDDWALRLTEAGDYGLALEVALSALHSDILRESAHRAVIRVHRAEGNVHEARRAFAACCSVLTQEIGVGPSPLTEALVP
jgi:DNA-binding SARP family transcriptional activator